MILRLRRRSVLMWLLLALSGRLVGAQASAATTMTGTIVGVITVSGSDLAFGTLLATQSKRVAAAAGGRFTIALSTNTPVTISYSLPASLAPAVALGAWELLSNTINDPSTAQVVPAPSLTGSFTASSSTGTIYLWIGATVGTTNAAVGSYSRPITVTITYN